GQVSFGRRARGLTCAVRTNSACTSRPGLNMTLGLRWLGCESCARGLATRIPSIATPNLAWTYLSETLGFPDRIRWWSRGRPATELCGLQKRRSVPALGPLLRPLLGYRRPAISRTKRSLR